MNCHILFRTVLMLAVALLFSAATASAVIKSQCPTLQGGSYTDRNGDGVMRADENEIKKPVSPNQVCIHLAAGDGFVTMADGKTQYIFSFANVTDIDDDMVMDAGMLAATFPAPPIVVKEGDELYLSLSNVGMMIRPDLFDPHTVHWHGFPQAAPVFDGVPDASISINMGSSLAYYYNVVKPGTYMYHCHVEATEHMQMGMLGNLYVLPSQDGTSLTHDGRTFDKFAYNDGDGSTGYNRDFAIQIGSFDSAFHDASETVQPLPFALMRDNYPMLNGRGYPDTVNPNPLPPPSRDGELLNGGKISQYESSLIEATPGERILLRLSNLNVTRFYTLASLGAPMKIVGLNARLLRGPDGKDLYYDTNSVTLGGGEAIDALIEIPADAAIGSTYFLYTTNLNYLANAGETNGTGGMGGMLTEIRVTLR